MTLFTKHRALALLAAACVASSLACAQSPAVNPAEADYAKQQQQRQVTQPLNNQPVWSEVRSGAPAYTSIPGRETNVLIQPQGQTWRAARVPIVFWGGIIFALSLLGTAAFYSLRGTMGGEYAPSGRLIERFSPLDRFAHWLVAISWTVLVLTGLVLSLGKSVLLPLIGYTLFSWLATLSKNLHNFVGPLLIIGTPLIFVRFIRDNLWNREDVKFFVHIMDYFKGHEYPSGRFNGGEKMIPFWGMVGIASPILVLSGVVMLFPNFDQTRQTMQIANVVHMVMAYLGIAMYVLHVYLGTVGFADSYQAMRYGYVDASWAEHNHRYWYEDVVAGRSRQHFASGDEAAPGDATARPKAA